MVAKHKKTGLLQNITQLFFILLVVFLIRTFVFGLYQVPTGSMETTMLVGERFFADKFTYLFAKPQRGHIISLNSPLYRYSTNPLKRLYEEYVGIIIRPSSSFPFFQLDGPVNLTKRVIGLPGERIKGTVEDGKPVIYINDNKLDEPYLNKYPLIGVWKSDPNALIQSLNQEVFGLLSQNQLNRSELENYFSRRLDQNLLLKSYDPSVAYENQPFYRIKESLIVKGEDGKPILKMPGVPIEGTGSMIKPEGSKNYWHGTDEFYVELGPNQYWLMGDNRRNSGDSRVFGPVDGRLIHGRILFRIWSIDSNEDWWIVDLIKHPVDFWTRIRWSRFLNWVH
jgi:signal peptidase I